MNYEETLETIKRQSLEEFSSDQYLKRLHYEYNEVYCKILKLNRRLLEIQALIDYRDNYRSR